MRRRDAPATRLADRLGALEAVRWLRELAQRSNTALVMTARADSPDSLGRPAFEDSWHGHWASPLFDDIADLRPRAVNCQDGATAFLATARGVGSTAAGTLRRVDGTTRLQMA